MKSQNSQKIQILVAGRSRGRLPTICAKTAQSLRLRGWTRNLMDGRVQVVVQGLSSELEQFCENLKKGPSFAFVEDLKVSETNETLNSDDFVILPDGETV